MWFSPLETKTSPGLRIGYASGPADLVRCFELYKQTTNLHTSSMVQTLLARYLRSHGAEIVLQQIAQNCRVYRDNRDAMVRSARRYLPGDVRFVVPTEGMFVWFELPGGYDAERMVERDGVDVGVLLVPGPAFSSDGGLKNRMRASFSMVTPEAIEEGMRRFASMLEREASRIS